MLAYHNDPKLKKSVVAEMKGHREADRLIKGQYWSNGKGCAVGCLIKSGNHSEYETRFGIPRVLARMEDKIFESLDNGASQKWPERFLKAIKPGADLSMVMPQFMLWLLEDPDGISKHASKDGKKVIKKIVALYKKKLSGKEPTAKQWLAVRDEAWKVRRAAAAYAAYAAYAADAAAAYAADAADAAADAAAAYAAARQAFWVRAADKLIELLKAAK